jgi:hypothetical protein
MMLLLHQIQQNLKIRRPQPRHRIPPFRRIPPRIRHIRGRQSRILICTCTSFGTSAYDVREAFLADGVEPWVEEAEGFGTGRETRVIEEGDYAGEGGGGCALKGVSLGFNVIQRGWEGRGEISTVPPTSISVKTPASF